ncbi:MAG TPA: AAC(3) family N-acetyltransferase [Pirellulales bacterium]|nr:AAC(3) family N-acetyltransferase [Pirellulales bacterium]
MTARTVFPALLERLGVRHGDHIYLHTSFSRLGYLEQPAERLIADLEDRIGPQGTLVMPSFAWNVDKSARPWKGYADYFRQRHEFDVRHTPANIGWVPEVFRRLPRTLRSASYWWSIAARGSLAEVLTRGQQHCMHSFGPGSSFDLLRMHGVKILGLGVSLNTTSLALVADAALANHPHEIFTAEPRPGVIVDETGRSVKTTCHWLLPEAVRLIKPSALAAASRRFAAAITRADHGETIHFCYRYQSYHDEALRLGRVAATGGYPVPWLSDYPLKPTFSAALAARSA